MVPARGRLTVALAVRPALDALVADLKAAGFPGSHYDPDLVNPPSAVWVQHRFIRNLRLDGSGTLVVWLYLLGVQSDDAGVDDILSKLDDALDGILDLLDESGIGLDLTDDMSVDLAAAVLLPGYAVPLPAYRLAVELDL